MPGVERRSLLSGGLGFVAAFALVWLVLPGRSAPEVDALAPAAREDPLARAAPRSLPAREGEREEPERAAPSPGVVEPAAPPAAAARAEPEPLGVLLHGTIQDASGAPLPDAMVWFTDVDGEVYRGASDRRGAYLLGPLPFGRHVVAAGKQGFHRLEVALDLAPPEADRRRDFVLRPQQVVRVDLVTSAGEPALPALAAAGVNAWRAQLVPVATREDPGETFTEVSGSLNNTFGIGHFEQAGMFDRPAESDATYGFVTLHEDGPAWLALVAAHQVLRKRAIEPAVTVVEFTLDPEDVGALRCALSARLVAAEDGSPLAGRVFVEEDPFAMGPGTEVRDDGLVQLSDLLPGERWLVLQAEGRAERVQPVVLAPGRALELGDVALHSPVELAGHVRTDEGAGIQAVLRWGTLDATTGDVRWVPQRMAGSEPDGSFSLPGLEPGLWVVQASGLATGGPRPPDPSRRSLAARADARQGPVLDLELVMRPTTTVTLACEGAAEPWPSVLAVDADGLRADSAWLGRWGKESQLHLPPGRYTLVFRRDGAETERRELRVEGAPQRIELRFDE